ncbi:hypothetical protein AUO94_13700 [Planococcus kocurii]|uniref:DUF4411 domain-containing protein n=1 Tax=Planococcus kocurii TaxID=1374 RepID=A0AAC9A3P9_9BACL|nr:DUF4411 family protein [Planococcus kocurii]ALS79614.1 hypothetical protein AUO94_13700 [Planococcus kocurii]
MKNNLDMENLKQYTIDTNVIRYDTNKTGAPDLKKAAKIFWRTIKEEVENGRAVILVPAEVVRELKVQSHTLTDNENSKTQKLLAHCHEISPSVSIELEHQIRVMSAYLRSKYKSDIGHPKMAYGGVSDARILYSAYYEDSILVTANIRDFLLYPFLFARHENRLYDLISNEFIQIPELVYAEVWQDDTFKKMFSHLGELEAALEDNN